MLIQGLLKKGAKSLNLKIIIFSAGAAAFMPPLKIKREHGLVDCD